MFNLLFADAAELKNKACDVDHDGCTRTEVGCWYEWSSPHEHASSATPARHCSVKRIRDAR